MWHGCRINEIHKKSFGCEPVGKRPLGIPRRGWEYNIKNDLKELRLRDACWLHMRLNKPSGSRNYWEFLN